MSSKSRVFTPSQRVDAGLLLRAQVGDPAARERLVERFGGIDPLAGHRKGGGLLRKSAVSVCKRCQMTPDDSTVQDVVAETYAAVLNPAITRYSPLRGTPATYLWLLALNAAKKIRALRSRTLIANGTDAAEEEGNLSLLAVVADESYRHPLDALADQEAATEADRFLAATDGVVREAVHRRYQEDEHWQDIATDLGVERTTLSRRVERCLVRVRRHLAHLNVA